MLMGVFYLHVLFAMLKVVPDPMAVPAALIQVKLLAGHVSVFFFLSGMGAPGLKRRSAQSVAIQSVTLLALAALSHLGGVLISAIIYGPPESWRDLFRVLVRPIVYGTGYSTFVAWFFIVLAVVRPLAWLFERNRLRFLIAVVAITLLILIGQWLHLPHNLYEWRNWPFALLFFMIGMRVPRRRQVPAWLGVGGLALSLAAAWLNGPDIMATGLCWTCNIEFLPFPMVGAQGFLPLALASEIAFLLFLLWASQLRFIPQIPWAIQWFGRASTQFLLLHGWMIAALWPMLTNFFPFPAGAYPYLLVLILNPLAHAAAYLALKPLLNRILAFCFGISRWLVEMLRRLVHRTRDRKWAT